MSIMLRLRLCWWAGLGKGFVSNVAGWGGSVLGFYGIFSFDVMVNSQCPVFVVSQFLYGSAYCHPTG